MSYTTRDSAMIVLLLVLQAYSPYSQALRNNTSANTAPHYANLEQSVGVLTGMESLRRRVAFQWFLTAFSVRPGICLAMSAHRLPSSWCTCTVHIPCQDNQQCCPCSNHITTAIYLKSP